MKGLGLVPSSFPPYGEPKGLVILVEYQDVRFSGTKDKPEEGEEPVFDAYDYFNRMLNEEGFSDYDGTGSARDWFIFNSNGLFMPHFDVYGPVTLPNKMKYYGGNDPYRNDRYPERMAIHACEILDETVDFSQYDTDGDGKIDNVFIFYAGLGEADGGGSDTVWPHSFDVSSATKKKYIFDGVQLDHYACSNEIDNQYNRPDGIGTFVHEFSHVLGLPDLYSTIYNDAFTPGDWSPLDSGPYNNQGRTPPNYSTFERYALGWMEPTEIKGLYSFTQQEDPENSDQREDPMQIPTRSDNSSDDSEEDPEEPNVTVECYTLPNLAEENVAFISWASDSEYFLFENRQKTGNDAYIPGHGMLVWHIDYNEEIWYYNQVNNTPSHQYVDLVEADNSKSTKSRSGDSFPGTKNKTSYGEETRPAFKTWSKEYMGFNLENIAESEDGIISFDVVRKVENGGTNGVGTSIASRDSWSVSGNVISCSGPTAVYDFSGRTVARLGAGESASLPSGLYIVRSSSRSGKILVK